jgi:hypothetical protein
MKIYRLIKSMYAPKTLGEGLKRVRNAAASESIMDGSGKTDTIGIYSKKYLGRNVTAEMTTDFHGRTRVVISNKDKKGIFASVLDRVGSSWRKVSYNILNSKRKSRYADDGINSFKETLKPEEIEREMLEIQKRV